MKPSMITAITAVDILVMNSRVQLK